MRGEMSTAGAELVKQHNHKAVSRFQTAQQKRSRAAQHEPEGSIHQERLASQLRGFWRDRALTTWGAMEARYPFLVDLFQGAVLR